MGETDGECVDEGDDGVGVGYGKGAAGAEVVLEVDDEEDVDGAECHCHERAGDSGVSWKTPGRFR